MPDELAPDDRIAGHADSLHGDLEELADDVDLPMGSGSR